MLEWSFFFFFVLVSYFPVFGAPGDDLVVKVWEEENSPSTLMHLPELEKPFLVNICGCDDF